jgi:hypothetical protein
VVPARPSHATRSGAAEVVEASTTADAPDPDDDEEPDEELPPGPGTEGSGLTGAPVPPPIASGEAAGDPGPVAPEGSIRDWVVPRPRLVTTDRAGAPLRVFGSPVATGPDRTAWLPGTATGAPACPTCPTTGGAVCSTRPAGVDACPAGPATGVTTWPTRMVTGATVAAIGEATCPTTLATGVTACPTRVVTGATVAAIGAVTEATGPATTGATGSATCPTTVATGVTACPTSGAGATVVATVVVTGATVVATVVVTGATVVATVVVTGAIADPLVEFGILGAAADALVEKKTRARQTKNPAAKEPSTMDEIDIRALAGCIDVVVIVIDHS